MPCQCGLAGSPLGRLPFGRVAGHEDDGRIRSVAEVVLNPQPEHQTTKRYDPGASGGTLNVSVPRTRVLPMKLSRVSSRVITGAALCRTR